MPGQGASQKAQPDRSQILDVVSILWAEYAVGAHDFATFSNVDRPQKAMSHGHLPT
jgi:hypothetical protein